MEVVLKHNGKFLSGKESHFALLPAGRDTAFLTSPKAATQLSTLPIWSMKNGVSKLCAAQFLEFWSTSHIGSSSVLPL